MLYAHLIYGIAGANQIWLAVLLRLAGRGQRKVRDEPVRHFLNDLVVGAVGLNGPCVIALRGNTARNVREGPIIKTSTTDRLLVFMLFRFLFFFFFFICRKDHEWLLFGYSAHAYSLSSVTLNANQCLHEEVHVRTCHL